MYHDLYTVAYSLGLNMSLSYVSNMISLL